jgi:hypothetical protein
VALRKYITGKKVICCCTGGHGRTGTGLSALLVASGMDAVESVLFVRTNYCNDAVESEAQERYLSHMHAWMYKAEHPEVTEKEIKEISDDQYKRMVRPKKKQTPAYSVPKLSPSSDSKGAAGDTKGDSKVPALFTQTGEKKTSGLADRLGLPPIHRPLGTEQSSSGISGKISKEELDRLEKVDSDFKTSLDRYVAWVQGECPLCAAKDSNLDHSKESSVTKGGGSVESETYKCNVCGSKDTFTIIDGEIVDNERKNGE